MGGFIYTWTGQLERLEVELLMENVVHIKNDTHGYSHSGEKQILTQAVLGGYPSPPISS